MAGSLLHAPASYCEQAETPQRCPASPAFERRRSSWALTFAKFTLVGSSGMVIDLAVFLGSIGFVNLGVARALGIGIAMTWNLFLNRQFTFVDCRPRSLWLQYFLFCASCFLLAVAHWGTSITLCYFWDSSRA